MSLRIVVTVKYVPDATGDRHFADDLTVDRDDVDGLLSELDEYAVEQALQISENSDDDVEITVLTVGPEDAKDALRKALSMGADKAIHVEDDDLHGTDASAPPWCWPRPSRRRATTWSSPAWPPPTAPPAWSPPCWPSAWASRRSPCCPRSPSRTAPSRAAGTRRRLRAARGLPAGRRVGHRPVGRGALPVLQGHHGGQEEAGGVLGPVRPRHRGGRGRPGGSWTAVDTASERPARTAGTIVKDEGEGGKQLAEYLASQKFI